MKKHGHASIPPVKVGRRGVEERGPPSKPNKDNVYLLVYDSVLQANDPLNSLLVRGREEAGLGEAFSCGRVGVGTAGKIYEDAKTIDAKFRPVGEKEGFEEMENQLREAKNRFEKVGSFLLSAEETKVCDAQSKNKEDFIEAKKAQLRSRNVEIAKRHAALLRKILRYEKDIEMQEKKRTQEASAAAAECSPSQLISPANKDFSHDLTSSSYLPDTKTGDQQTKDANQQMSAPVGGMQLPAGGVHLPDEGMQLPDGGMQLPDGSMQLPDGGVQLPAGGVQLPDGGVLLSTAQKRELKVADLRERSYTNKRRTQQSKSSVKNYTAYKEHVLAASRRWQSDAAGASVDQLTAHFRDCLLLRYELLVKIYDATEYLAALKQRCAEAEQREEQREEQELTQLHRTSSAEQESSRQLQQAESQLMQLQAVSTKLSSQLAQVEMAVVNMYNIARRFRQSLPPLQVLQAKADHRFGDDENYGKMLELLKHFLEDAQTAVAMADSDIRPDSTKPTLGSRH